VDLKDIKAIIDLMRKNAISEFELERQDFKIKLKRSGNGGTVVGSPDDSPGLVYASAPPVIVAAPPGSGAPGSASASSEIDIKSPMVGTFYRSPSPDSGPYVEIGTEINADAVVCIIEAMKVMNEIKSEVRGVITQVLIENGKPVEYGQPLFKVRPL
jgi:acetyl-CoA carboxylase biotin carboxyl carrier protein